MLAVMLAGSCSSLSENHRGEVRGRGSPMAMLPRDDLIGPSCPGLRWQGLKQDLRGRGMRDVPGIAPAGQPRDFLVPVRDTG